MFQLRESWSQKLELTEERPVFIWQNQPDVLRRRRTSVGCAGIQCTCNARRQSTDPFLPLSLRINLSSSCSVRTCQTTYLAISGAGMEASNNYVHVHRGSSNAIGSSVTLHLLLSLFFFLFFVHFLPFSGETSGTPHPGYPGMVNAVLFRGIKFSTTCSCHQSK